MIPAIVALGVVVVLAEVCRYRIAEAAELATTLERSRCIGILNTWAFERSMMPFVSNIAYHTAFTEGLLQGAKRLRGKDDAK